MWWCGIGWLVNLCAGWRKLWIDYDENCDENCDMLWWRLVMIVIVPHIDVKFMRKMTLCDKACDSEAEPGG